MSRFEHIVIAGCNGQFGGVLGRKLAGSAERLTGVDVAAAAADPGLWSEYAQGSIERPDARVLDLVAAADCVLLCVPEAAVLGGLEALLAAARPDACLADIASVKTRIAARVEALGGTTGYLGLHPMFAPAEPFVERNLVVVRIRENAATMRLEGVAAAWRARMTVLSADEHDRLAACVQVIPHAALLALGAALADSGVDRAASERIATPVHETMLSLVARVLRGRSETYWSIQTDNPYAAAARAGLMGALQELDAMATRGDDAEFGQLVHRVSAHLGDAFDDLAVRSERVVAAAREPDERSEPK